MDRREFLLAQAGAVVAATVQPTLLKKRDHKPPVRFPIALWLAPVLEDRREIQKTIDRLTRQSSKFPPFKAHATLCTVYLPDLGDSLKCLLDTVDSFCRNRMRMSWDVVDGADKIDHRDSTDKLHPKEVQKSAWGTFLFLALQQDKLFKEAETAFQRFAPTLKPDVNDCTGNTVLSHISLAYCDPTSAKNVGRDAMETELRGSIKLKKVTFDAIEVVMPQSGDWNNIISTTRDRWNIIYSRRFRPPDFTGLRCVVTGGQVGVDQIALQTAKATAGLETGGWCPPDFETQPAFPPIPYEFLLQETPEGNSTGALGVGAGAGPGRPRSVPRSLRTEWNCRDSDGTLIIAAASGHDLGTIWTVKFAHEYEKPIRSCRLLSSGFERDEQVDSLLDWLREHKIEVLNVAGPAALDSAEQDRLKEFLLELFRSAVQKRD